MWLGMAKNGGLEQEIKGNRTSEIIRNRLYATRFPMLNKVINSDNHPLSNVTAKSQRFIFVQCTDDPGKRERRVL